MGKQQHSKDRMFLTRTEWNESGGGKKVAKSASYRPLAFDACALSLQPYETPVCTSEGVVFDILNLFPYVQKHKKSPITGQHMSSKDILRLNMHKNAEEKWHCPVTYKEFNNNTHIVAIKPSGNVFAYEAVEELNIRARNWTDLLTGEPFTRKDIMTLQDPSNAEHMALRDISNFKHLQEMREEEAAKAAADQGSGVRSNPSIDAVLNEFNRQKKEKDEEEARKQTANEAKAKEEEKKKGPKILLEDLFPGKKITSGKAAASFTASGLNVTTGNECREATEYEIREARWKIARKLGKKGYVQLQTTLGQLNLELHCDFTPRTTENFLGLCCRGFYNGLNFHRLVKGFMIQGGDPRGTGTGGETMWGPEPFKDEFDSRLLHDKRGILSMANSGRDTNRSQFFLTFKGCRHLDNQHTVFGRLVGGGQTLDRIEAVEIDKKDRPLQEIKINNALVLSNPFDDVQKQFDDHIAERVATREANESFKRDHNALGSVSTNTAAHALEQQVVDKTAAVAQGRSSHVKGTGPGGVGKYMANASKAVLPKLSEKRDAKERILDTAEVSKRRKAAGETTFADFSAW